MYSCDLMSVVFFHSKTPLNILVFVLADYLKDPAVQQATGETDPIGVMKKLREMKNSFK